MIRRKCLLMEKSLQCCTDKTQTRLPYLSSTASVHNISNPLQSHLALSRTLHRNMMPQHTFLLGICLPRKYQAQFAYTGTPKQQHVPVFPLLSCQCTDIKLDQMRQFSTSSVLRSFSQKWDEEEDKYSPSKEGMNIRFHAENVYLSWMRNTYLMTIAGITILNFAVTQTPAVISALCLTIAGTNLTIGSIGYIWSLSFLRQRRYMSYGISLLVQLGTVVHCILWTFAATLLFPQIEIVDEELVKAEEDEKKGNDSSD